MKVTFFSAKEFEIDSLKKANKGIHELNFVNNSLSDKTAALAKDSDVVCVFPNDDVSASVLEKLAQLDIKYIANRAAGYDHIDLNKASELNFRVAYVPEYSPYAIAEHTVAMILTMNRKLIQANEKIRRLDFTLTELIGFDLNGKTVGIIGLGRIGGIVAKILHGFGCKILGYDININSDLIKKYSVKYCELDYLYANSDIITLHTPLNTHTKYLINKDKINLMKKGVMIVNTGRGELINTADAIEALKKEHIDYLGLDVYEKEKNLFFYDHSNEALQDEIFAQLLSFKNVLITGHQAFLTENALVNIADTTIYNLNCWEKGESSKYELTKSKVKAL